MSYIFGYLGRKEAFSKVLKGLHKRSFGSFIQVGIGLCDEKFSLFRTDRNYEDLQYVVDESIFKANCAIGKAYTEKQSTKFYGPKYCYDKTLQIVFTGILENYTILRKVLFNKGIRLDTHEHSEAFVNFVRLLQEEHRCNIEYAIRMVLDEVKGHYSFLLISKENGDHIYAATKDLPLIVGINENEHFISSDEKSLTKSCDQIIPIREDQIAVISDEYVDLKDFEKFNLNRKFQDLNMRTDSGDKMGYDHYLLKEIHDQKYTIQSYIKEFINAEEGRINFPHLSRIFDDVHDIERILIIAQGTSYYAGLVGEYMIEQLGRIPVKVEYASELRYKDIIVRKNDLVLFISKSGEAPDTLACFDKVRKLGVKTIVICNNANSSIAVDCDALIQTKITQEYGVFSANSFSSQYFMLCMIALTLSKEKQSLPITDFRDILFQLDKLPSKIETVLNQEGELEIFANSYKKHHNIAFLGRSNGYAISREAAHLMRKVAGIHAESYPAAELKDSPIALIDEGMPAVVIANSRKSYKKVVSNVKEVIARKGRVLGISKEGDKILNSLTSHIVEIPLINDMLAPFLTILPIQLLVYYSAVARGEKIDLTEIHIEEEPDDIII